jgi:hypothetical protein
MRLLVPTGACQSTTEFESAGSAAWVQVRVPSTLRGLSPGFFMIVGSSRWPNAALRTWRLYFSLRAATAAQFLAVIGDALDERAVPYRLKVSNDPASYYRCDAGVLYVPGRREMERALEVVASLRSTLRPMLRDAVPAFTRCISNGIALAADPGNGESFGMDRCGLVARALLGARNASTSPVGDRVAAIRREFEEAGLNPDRPYLSAEGEDIASPPSLARQVAPSEGGARAPEAHLTATQSLEAARCIGRLLCARAIRHGGRATWLGGALGSSRFHITDPAVPSARTLLPDLYSGNAGMALFLGELYVHGCDDDCGIVARAAIEQALLTVTALSPRARLGFYSGIGGVGYAAIRLGPLLGDDSLIDRGRELIELILSAPPTERQSDLVFGSAGLIALLLWCSRVIGERRYLDHAVVLGDALLARGASEDAGLSWAADDGSRRRLTGLAHGASGPGHAFVELATATGDTRYRQAALAAFDYERGWYDAHSSNWQDLRRPPRGAGAARRFATAWCHGAAGIALTRARALGSVVDDSVRKDAIAGINTIRAALVSALGSEGADLSLCHGLVGLAEILDDCSSISSAPDRDEIQSLTRKAAGVAQTRIGTEDGMGQPAFVPGLFDGFAGVGYFHLRRFDPTIPTVLLPGAA